jgi:hypothetical protein
MLENIAKALTRRLLQDNPGVGSSEWTVKDEGSAERNESETKQVVKGEGLSEIGDREYGENI